MNTKRTTEAAPRKRGRKPHAYTPEELAAMSDVQRRRHEAYERKKLYDQMTPEERARAVSAAKAKGGRIAIERRGSGDRTVSIAVKASTKKVIQEIAEKNGISVSTALKRIVDYAVSTLRNNQNKE